MSDELRARRGALVTGALLALAAVCVVAFLTIGARGSWSFVLAFRGERLAALILVGWAIAVSTVLFQTLTQNRILTPAIMGFDALFVLIQTTLVFSFGSAAVSSAHPWLIFGVELALMGGGAALLFRWLFDGETRSLHLLMLVGVVLGVLFRGVAGFLQRLISPDEFVVLQDRLFASFGSVDGDLLVLSAILIAGASVAVVPLLPALDVLVLGRDNAILLGVDHRRVTAKTFALVTIFVAVSTALVGPVAFFGLMVANLAYQIAPGARHAGILPIAGLIAVVCLVGGQTLLERVLAFDGTLGMVIELLGGATLILLLIRGLR